MRRSINSADLDSRLKQLVQKQNKIEEEYRETNQRFWTIAFIDVSSSAKDVWDLGEDAANQIFASYQEIVRAALKANGSCFIEAGGGPQIVCCFENPETCLLAAQAVLAVMEEWSDRQEAYRLRPCIGVHQGYINFHDGTIHQSNTNNKAKRIQTESRPGRVFVSREVRTELAANPQFAFKSVGTFSLKNIPEPQEIFEVSYRVLAEFDAFSVSSSQKKAVEEKRKPTVTQESHQWVFVYIDVCESTKKFWKFGDREASRLIEEYQKLCHTTFTQCGCAYAKSCEGDQIIGAFEMDDANMAVVSSIKILKDLFRRNVNTRESQQVRAAIGIHMGEVILEGDEPVTTGDMRVGKAIQSQATADEILISHEVVALGLDYQIQESLYACGEFEFSEISDSFTVLALNWTHAQLRPSLLHPPMRGKAKRGRTSY